MPQTVGQTILDLLAEHHLATAPELISQLEAKGHTANKTSVYRALDKLLAKNTICKQNLFGNELHYELREHHHDHLVCLKCGKVIATECQVDIKAPENFKVDHHHLTVFGWCQGCTKI